MITIHTVETRLEIQYIVFITIVEDTMGRRRGLRPFALSVVACETTVREREVERC
jgi:hypothetical protein